MKGVLESVDHSISVNCLFWEPLNRTCMKNAMVQLALVLIGITGVHAVRLLQSSSSHAPIYPAVTSQKTPVVHGGDSLKNAIRTPALRP
jgi:hypothetical protein